MSPAWHAANTSRWCGQVAEELLRVAFDDSAHHLPPIYTIFDTFTVGNRSYKVCQGGCAAPLPDDAPTELHDYERVLCFERLLSPSPAHKDFEGVEEATPSLNQSLNPPSPSHLPPLLRAKGLARNPFGTPDHTSTRRSTTATARTTHSAAT